MADGGGDRAETAPTGGDPLTEVTPADDSFHAPATDDPFWTETAWFGFSVPERRMSGAVYPLFRPNQGVCSAGVYVWDDSGQELWQLPYARNAWHAPMPDHDLRELRLLNGLEYDCVEPLTTYRVRYADADEIALDLTFEALHPPHGIGLGSGSGHVDQAGRMTGTLDLHGERITVDCVEMRDRSWGVRRDHGMVRAGYHYGFADGRNGFQAMSFLNGDEQVIVAGYLLEDGELVRLVSGTVKVVRTDTAPVEVVLDAQDARGHGVQAHG